MQEWQTDAFRNSLVRKLEEAIRESGVTNQRSAAEMENQVFSRSKFKEEYLSYVAKLILHVKQQGRRERNLPTGDNSQGMGNMSGGNVQQSMMINTNNMQQMQQGRVQIQGMPVSQQQQMMQQQQQQMQIRARLQQQQQQQSQQMQGQQQLAQQQQQQMGPRMSQLQQALQQRPQGADLQGNMRQPGMGRGINSGGFTMIPGLQTSGPSNVSAQGPSPLPYAQSPQGQIGNPSPGTTIPSPVGGRSNSLAPSPSSQVNTPMNPASQEEKEYQEKIKSLEKYIEPLRRMILGIGNEDNEKLGKMKKLLHIMSNPDQRMPLPTLQKCEEVLKRMLQQQVDSTDADQADAAGIGNNADKNPLIEAIIKVNMASKGVNLNNSLNNTFLPPMEALMGPEISLPPLPRTPPPLDAETRIPMALEGEIARLDPRFKVWLDSCQADRSSSSVELVCQLEDRDLPAVPNLYVTVPRNYPDSAPQTNLENPDYLSTPFLREISGALCSRMEKMPNQHTLSQLLSAWELSVRSACAPSPLKYQKSNTASLIY